MSNNPKTETHSIRQLRILNRLENQPKRVAFLNHYMQYANLAYASGLAGITKNQGNNLLISLRTAGFEIPSAHIKRTRTHNERIEDALNSSKFILGNPNGFLTEKYGGVAPDYRTKAGRSLIKKALLRIGSVTVKQATLVEQFCALATKIIYKEDSLEASHV